MKRILKTYLAVLYELYTSPAGQIIATVFGVIVNTALLLTMNLFAWLFLNAFVIAPAVYVMSNKRYLYPDPFDGRRYGHDKR